MDQFNLVESDHTLFSITVPIGPEVDEYRTAHWIDCLSIRASQKRQDIAFLVKTNLDRCSRISLKSSAKLDGKQAVINEIRTKSPA